MSVLSQRLTTALADRYRIERELGRGGMATVFLAEDLKHHRRVALKVLDPEVASAIGPVRFRREIDTVARLSHPHILPLHDSGEAGGLLYYVMPFVAGETLRQRLEREKQLPLDEALRLTREVADALEYAHGQGVVHRDIKPENILLEGSHARLADFGIARAAVSGERLTTTGVMLGTPAYMSPEQVAGGAADARSDIYALGCVMYEMLAGQAPFTGPTAESVVYQHLNAAPPQVTAMRPGVPATLEQVITRAMAKTPADRYATTGEFVTALTAGSSAPAGHEILPPGHSVRTALLAAAVLVIVAGVLLVTAGPGRGLWQRGPARPSQPFWIVLSEFEGPPDDPVLTAAVQDLVRGAIDASGVVAVLPRDRVRFVLQRAGKPDTLQVTGDLAREIAVRSGVRAVLEGSLRRAGAGYAVVLRVSNPDSGQTVVTVTGTATDADALIPSTLRMAARVLQGMRQRQTEIASYRFYQRPPATPSFEAYRRLIEASRAFGRFDYPTARQMYHRALALDPGYASAWAALGALSWNQGMGDSARICLEEALRHRERATPEERLAWEAQLADGNGDVHGAMDAYSRLIAMGGPGVTRAYLNRGAMLSNYGLQEQALADCDSATARTPKGMNQLLMSNRCELLLQLGRMDEARKALEPLTGRWRKANEPWFAVYAGEWSSAESVAVATLSDPSSGNPEQARAHSVIAARQAARGQVTNAFHSLARLESSYPHLMIWYVVRLAQVSGRTAELPPGLFADTSRTSPAGMWVDTLTRALALAWKHDAAGAERLLRLRKTPDTSLTLPREPLPPVVRALIAEDRQRWGEVLGLLEPMAREDQVRSGMWMGQVRWMVADAFERLGRADSAAAWFESALRPDRQYRWEHIGISMTSSLVHQRLVMLYARMGRIPDAERHLAALEREFTDPDADMRRLLEDARAAVRAARGMGKTAPPRT